MHHYLQKYKWNDLNYIGTLGFDKELIADVQNIEGVEAVDYGFRFDALMSYKDKSNIGITVYSDDDFQNGVDLPELKEGRFPKKDNECLLDYHYFIKNDLKLNQTIQIKSQYGTKSYCIVGVANDSRYTCDFERGTNSLGNGNNSAFVLILTKGNEKMAVPDSLFELYDQKTFYNDLRIHLENPDDLYEFDDDYDEYVKPINKKIKAIFKNYYDSLYNDIINDAYQEINDGQNSYEEGLQKYNEGLQSYQDGLASYNHQKKAYEEGYTKYLSGLKQYEQGYSQYQSGLQQYQAGYSQYQDGLNQYNASQIQIEEGLALLGGYEQACLQKNYLESIGQTDNENYQQIVALINGYDALPSIKLQLDENEAKLKESKTILDRTYQQLISSKKTLDQTGQQLANAKKQLDDAKIQLDKN
ncbi:MAG: hypothetical protein ACI4SR_01895, partial [Faecalibacillus sp.]